MNLIISDAWSTASDTHTLACNIEVDAGAETQGPTISAQLMGAPNLAVGTETSSVEDLIEWACMMLFYRLHN